MMAGSSIVAEPPIVDGSLDPGRSNLVRVQCDLARIGVLAGCNWLGLGLGGAIATGLVASATAGSEDQGQGKG
jgi:hypothetical protein